MNEPVRLADFSAPPSVFPGVLADADRLNRQVTLKTNKGDIVVELYGDAAPKAVSNFLVLAKTGFYDQVKFHRVIKGFMIQAGDPQSADDSKVNAWGTGGPGYRFADELGGKYTTYERGTLAMANSGSNTNGSQFFIMHADYALPNKYTVFGKVVKGLEVVDAIANTPTKPNDQPKEAIIIKSMSIK
jgi:cyclophilin family peptidyl-prolyl cis-trans isomerase